VTRLDRRIRACRRSYMNQRAPGVFAPFAAAHEPTRPWRFRPSTPDANRRPL
jgi:hypothetical protein